MSNKAQALIESLQGAICTCGIEGMPEEADAIQQAIKAIEVLSLIAEKGGQITRDGVLDDWCAEQARNYLESIK